MSLYTTKADLEQEEPEPRLRDTPEDISFEAAANTIAFHPSQDILAAGDVDGDVYVYSYSCLEGGNRELWSSGHHLKSCREVSFSHDGHSDRAAGTSSGAVALSATPPPIH
uniref:Uncharacterized protein n=1 Tax=Chelonoidis abingdonii TaxID=106734 RepID=A0A8C0QMM6_CHEAB